jgi:hypothetical protein
VSVPSADALANTSLFQVIANHDRVVDGLAKGSEAFAWTIQGTDVDGSAFELGFTDRFASSYDLSWDVGFALGDIVYALGQIDGVSIEAINANAEFVQDSSTYQISAVQQFRNGAWVTVGRGEPAIVRAGKRFIARVVLVSGQDTLTVPVSFDVPQRAEGRRATLSLIGGNELYSWPDVSSIAKARRYLRNLTRNDQVLVDFGTTGGYYGGGEVVEGRGRHDFDKTKELGPVDKVVGGAKRVKVIIR